MQTKTKIKSNPAFMIGILMIAIFVFAGCEKVINLNLVEAKPQLVIEGLITDGAGPYTVKLSKTGSYFNQPVLPLVSNAVVIISDNLGITDTLKETKPGIYLTSKVKGIMGRTYNLSVLSENIMYTGSSTMFTHVPIDSLKLRKSYSEGIAIGSDGQQDARVEIHCFFRDPPEKNFYRAYIYTNGNRGYEDYKLYDDQYTNDKQTDLQVKRAHIGDIIRVDLFSLDKSTYEYYRTFTDLIHSNPIFGSTPMNPNTNLTNGALGFFGACAISTKTIIVTDSLYNSAK